jgi:riboflavin transporter FmnP
MQLLGVFLRFVLGLLFGCLGLFAVTVAVYLLANARFTWTGGPGAVFAVILGVGGLLLWAAWTFVRQALDLTRAV